MILQFADDAKQGGAINVFAGRAVIQSNPDRLERWASRDIAKFSKDKCQVLHLGRKEAFARTPAGV